MLRCLRDETSCSAGRSRHVCRAGLARNLLVGGTKLPPGETPSSAELKSLLVSAFCCKEERDWFRPFYDTGYAEGPEHCQSWGSSERSSLAHGRWGLKASLCLFSTLQILRPHDLGWLWSLWPLQLLSHRNLSVSPLTTNRLIPSAGNWTSLLLSLCSKPHQRSLFSSRVRCLHLVS